MKNEITLMDKIIALSKQRGFVYPSSEIYGGFAATYDFGPLGQLLKKNLESMWRYWNVTSRTDMMEIEGAIFMHPKTWEASGHLKQFADLLVEDTVTHKRYRADHLIEEAGIMENAGGLTAEETDKVIVDNKLKSPDGNPLSAAKKFNMMVKTHLGAVEDESSVVYLKGESCQNIYLDWKAVQESTRRKLPFGIAQIGKAFRNEINVKNYLFRTRELEQMDTQYFCKPAEADGLYTEWKQYHWDYYTKFLGIPENKLRWRQHTKDEQAFYAKDAWDVEYDYEGLGFKEIEGVHHRGSYDLDQHSKFSGQDLSYFDQETNERFNPYIVECSAGFGRLFLMCMFEFYREETVEDEKRVVLAFPDKIAPAKFAFLPLFKKDGLSEITLSLHAEFRKKGFSCEYDETASIGKRYRRQDEIGTPYCITVDYDTLKDKTVTVRHRDSMKQERVAIADLDAFFAGKFDFTN